MKDDVLNTRRRRLLRRHIPLGENLVSLAVVASLALLLVWVGLQKQRYDPDARSVPDALLRQASSGLQLYAPPRRRAAADAVVDLAPYPAAVTADGWRPTAPPRRFDANTLFEKINGEAPKFIRQGLVAMHYLVLRAPDDTAEIAIELFDQADIGGSLGVFSEHLGPDRVVERLDGASFYRTSIGAVGRAGRYFFRLAGDAPGAAVSTKTRSLLAALATLAPPAQKPAAAAPADAPAGLRLLAAAFGVDETRITSQKHNVFQYDFAKDFWFARFADDGPARAFVHLADDAAAAQTLFEQLLDELGYDYRVIQRDDGRALLEHAFLANVFSLARRGRAVFGVENAADRAQAERARTMLAGALAAAED